MSQKQQALMNLLNKYVRQYFVFHMEREKPAKVRLRNEVHCVEEAKSPEAKEQRLKQRIFNDYIGQMTPQYMSYEPVSGWPVLRLEELVLNSLEKRLDGKVWEIIRSHLEKSSVRRVVERKDLDGAIKDLSVVFKYPTAGFNRIKAHLAETEARMHYVKAGSDFQQHLIQTCEERHRREAPKPGSVQKFSADPDIIVAKERVRKDTINFLVTLKDLLEKMLQLKVRHLRSPNPIALNHLGTEKDRAFETHRQTGRVLQYPGGPPVNYSFKEQIITDAPPGWPLASKYAKKGARTDRLVSVQSSVSSFENKRCNRKTGVSATSSRRVSRGALPTEKEDYGPQTTNRMFQVQQMQDSFRKRWPPVWMSLAALDQGCNIVDPQCPTREYADYNASVKQKKSLSDVLATRNRWAEMRQAVDKSVEETLWREDKERLQFFRVQYASLSCLPLSKPYPTHSRHMDQLLAETRTQRQTHTIFDCELTHWYKYLVVKVQEDVGKCEEEINDLLEEVKFYFKMSANSPRYAKAKLALITMSLPAHVVTKIYVQRALRFILCHVLQAPETMLIGWLAIRGLPFILLSSHAI